MAESIEFARNYNDLSTTRGFQFEFYCDRCGGAFRTEFQPSVTGIASEVLGAASSLFGGLFGGAADASNRAQSATHERSHDEAFRKAVKEVMPEFIQCPRCVQWVCRKKCWNNDKGICKHCAPDLGVEMSAAQASRSVEEVWAHAAMAEKDKKLSAENWRETIRASCPKCETPLSANLKFCPNCGESLKAPTHCPKCKAELAAGAKFCGECGTKV